MVVTFDFTAVETGIYSKLSTAAGTVLWGAGTAARVYADQAPQGAADPYLVFLYAGGGDENLNPAGSFDVLYQVECWSRTLSQARLGMTYINAALHYKTLTIAGVTNFWTAQQGLIRSVENVEGVQWYRRGATYQIRGS
jgi:hypothetical protein